MNTQKNYFLKMTDLTRDELTNILSLTDELKNSSDERDLLRNRSICMLFEKPSTRTRVSFEVGITELGGNPVVLNASEIQLSRGEPVRDTARVLDRYASGVVARVFAHRSLEELVEFGSIPVVNALSDLTHPCQILADFFTIKEFRGSLEDQVITYVGDGNNVCHSLILGTAVIGGTLRVATPEGYEPDESILKEADRRIRESGGSVDLFTDPKKAAGDADVLYTDVWASMGQEEEKQERKKEFKGYQINSTLLERANDDAIVMHCLPAHRGEEITDDVIEGDQSVVWDQAENRLHAQKALLTGLYS